MGGSRRMGGGSVRKVFGFRDAGRVGYRVLAIVLATALGLVSLLTAGPATAATRQSGTAQPFAFSMDPIVGVRQTDPDSCSVGPVS